MLLSIAIYATISILYQMPSFILYGLKRPQVDIHLNLIFTFEIFWYLPQVLIAGAASAIFESAGFEYISSFIYDFDFRPDNSPVIFCNEAPVLLACLADNGIIYREA